MVRPNSIIALGAREDTQEYDYADDVTFYVYEPKDVETEVYDMAGKRVAKLRVVRDGEMIAIEAQTNKPFTVRLIHMEADSAEGAELSIVSGDSVLKNCGPSMKVRL